MCLTLPRLADGCRISVQHLCSKKLNMCFDFSCTSNTYALSFFAQPFAVFYLCVRHPYNAMASGVPGALFLYMWCTLLAASCADTTTVAFDA